jgi:hypothetical protein
VIEEGFDLTDRLFAALAEIRRRAATSSNDCGRRIE